MISVAGALCSERRAEPMKTATNETDMSLSHVARMQRRAIREEVVQCKHIPGLRFTPSRLRLCTWGSAEA